MRATPPCARMSAGTRSRAITATAPASSAIFGLVGGDHVHDDAALEHLGQTSLESPGARFASATTVLPMAILFRHATLL